MTKATFRKFVIIVPSIAALGVPADAPANGDAGAPDIRRRPQGYNRGLLRTKIPLMRTRGAG